MRLEVMQTMWAMRPYGPKGETVSGMAEAVEMIAEAGYDGVCIELGAQTEDEALECVPLLKKHGLSAIVNAFPKHAEDLEKAFLIARETQARFVNIIPQVFTVVPEGSVGPLREMIDFARHEDIELLVETHRWCTTTDMFTTLWLMDAIPEMRLTADLSHYVVGREVRIPLDPLHASLFRRILERCDSFQGRIATRQQVQVPIDFPQHKKWVDAFEGWWADGFRDWKARAKEDDVCVFLCELGPPEYAMTDAQGHELSDRWAEALWMKDRVREIWAGA